jgi:hypothetical protein
MTSLVAKDTGDVAVVAYFIGIASHGIRGKLHTKPDLHSAVVESDHESADDTTI